MHLSLSISQCARTLLPLQLSSAVLMLAVSEVLLSSIALTIFLAIAGVTSSPSARAGAGPAVSIAIRARQHPMHVVRFMIIPPMGLSLAITRRRFSSVTPAGATLTHGPKQY